MTRHPCRVMFTRGCPLIWPAGCVGPCARFESEDERPWLAELPPRSGKVCPGCHAVFDMFAPGQLVLGADAEGLYLEHVPCGHRGRSGDGPAVGGQATPDPPAAEGALAPDSHCA